MDPNSLDIHQPQATLVNLITPLAWIPLNFLQPATPTSGPLDGQHSIRGDPTGMGHWADSPNFLEQAHVGLTHMNLPFKTENPNVVWSLTS